MVHKLKHFCCATLSAALVFASLAVVPVPKVDAAAEEEVNLAPNATYSVKHIDPSHPDYDPTSNPAWNKPDETGVQLTDGLYGQAGNYDDEAWVGFSAYADGTASTVAEFCFENPVELSSVVTSCHPAVSEYGIEEPAKITVFVSQDGSNWTQVAEDSSPNMKDLKLDAPVEASYVKVACLNKAGVGWIYLDEIQLLGKIAENPGGAPDTKPEAPQLDPRNLADRANYTIKSVDPSHPGYDPSSNAAWNKPDETGKQLTDGVFGNAEDYEDPAWVGFSVYTEGNAVTVTEFQFDKAIAMDGVKISCSPESAQYGISPPAKVTVSVSQNGQNWTPVAEITDDDPNMLDITLDQAYLASYVRIDCLNKAGFGWLLLDEIQILGTEDIKDAVDPTSELLSHGKSYQLYATDTEHGATPETFVGSGWLKPDTEGVEMTDGIHGNPESYDDAPWAGFSGWPGTTVTTVTVDLGSLSAVDHVHTDFYPAGSAGIENPASVQMFLSADGDSWMDMGIKESETADFQLPEAYQAQFVHLDYVHKGGWVIMDEVSVYGSKDPTGAKELDVNPVQNLAVGKAYTLTFHGPDGALELPAEGIGSDAENKKLTDGICAVSMDPEDNAWVGIQGTADAFHGFKTGTTVTEFEMDLGHSSSLERIRIGFCKAGEIIAPARMTVYLSQDGQEWIKQSDFTDYRGMSEYRFANPIRAQYVRLAFQHSYEWLLMDEIQIDGRTDAESLAAAVDPISCDVLGGQVPHVENPRPEVSIKDRFPNHAAEDPLTGYKTQTGNMRDIVLLYNQFYKDGIGDYTVEKLYPYLAYVDREGNAVDTMFDSVLFLALNSHRWDSNDGQEVWRSFTSHGTPADKLDYEWYLQKTFGPNGDMAALQQTAEKVAADLGCPDYRVKTVIMAPFPTEDFGMGSKEAFLNWYMESVMELFASGNYSRIDLAGFYILEESLYPAHYDMVKQITGFAHEKNMQVLWIPYFGAGGVSDEAWKTLGIDAVMYQPNSYFYEVDSGNRVHDAAVQAATSGTGMEIENDLGIFKSWESFDRAMDYLDASVLYHFQGNQCLRAYYQWVVGYERYCYPMRENPDFVPGTPAYERGRQLYESTYQMMRGKLKLSNRTVPADAIPEEEIKVSGTTIHLPKKTGYEYSLDGIHWRSDPVFRNLNPDTVYTFYQRMAETKTYSSGMVSLAAEVTTGAESALPTPPIVTAIPGDGFVELRWNAPTADSGVTGYKVLVNGTEKLTLSADPVECKVTGLVNGETYSFVVRAVSAAGTVDSEAITAKPIAPPEETTEPATETTEPATEASDPTTEVTESTTEAITPATKPGAPDTGDAGTPLFWIWMACLSIVGVLLLNRRFFRSNAS